MREKNSFPSLLLTAASTAAALAMMIIAAFTLSASNVMPDNVSTSAGKNGSGDFAMLVDRLVAGACAEVADIPMTYVLPVSDETPPRPNPDGYFTRTEDGVEYTCYEDSTISVKCWDEEYFGNNCSFADITVAHPSQLRRAFADDFGSSARYFPSAIAARCNAVVAMNSDFYNFRDYGYVIQYGRILRANPRFTDTLLIDSNGDFHTLPGAEVETSGILDEFDIVYGISFGPTIVENGKAVDSLPEFYNLGEIYSAEPRSAIGQIGPLHYLFCTVEGRSKSSEGLSVLKVAQIMESEGCVSAYNLDGGQTATIVFNGRPYNNVADGGERTVSDIIYFATALPESEWGRNE